MPRVAHIDTILEGQGLRVEVWFTRKDGFSLKGLPERVKNINRDRRLSHLQTLEQAEEQVAEMIDAYHTLIKRTRKVILYRLNLSRRVACTSRPHEYGGTQWIQKPWVGERVSSERLEGGYGFVIGWRLAFEVSGEKTVYHQANADDVPGFQFTRQSLEQVMDWTPEREEWFKAVDLQTEELAKKLAAFFNQETETIAQGIDAGTMKLIG